MNVQRPKVPPKLLLPLNPNVLEVLVAEDHHAPLGDEQRELVLLRIAELRELQAADLGADDGCELGYLQGRVFSRQEVWLGLVGCSAAVREGEGLQGREVRLGVVDGEVGGVFVLGRVSSGG